MITGILYFLGILFSYPIQLIFFKRKTYYEDKKVQSRRIRKGALIVSNHKSLKDFMMYMFAFPFRKLYCLMSELVFNKGVFLNYLITVLGGIKVDRSTYEFSFIGKSVELLKKNKLLVIFPEAKLPLTSKMQKFYPSYLLIALKSNVPIIPVYTDGNYGLFKRSHMMVGKPINLRDYCSSIEPSKDELNELNLMVRNRILDLEKQCKERINKDKYGKRFSITKLFCDLGRLVAISFNLHFRVKVINAGKRKKKLKQKGGYVIVANHSNFIDPLLLICAFFRRRIHILTAEVVMDNHPIRAKLLKTIGCIRIDRNVYDYDAINLTIDVLKAGGVVVVFPEGHLTKEFSTEKFKSGAALLAHRAKVPILPVYIDPNKQKFGRHHVYLGDLIDVKEICEDRTLNTQDLDNISQLLLDNICKLEAQVKNGGKENDNV